MAIIKCKVHSISGLNPRTCAELVAEANRANKCSLCVVKDGETADLKSIMNMMSLIIKANEEFIIKIEGNNEDEIKEKFIKLLSELKLLND